MHLHLILYGTLIVKYFFSHVSVREIFKYLQSMFLAKQNITALSNQIL